MMKKLGLIVILLSFGLWQGAQASSLEDIIAGDQRSAKNKARDQYRHPANTLHFFGLKNDMTVVELWPGGGWYQEIIAPYLNEKGKYYGSGPAKYTKSLDKLAAEHPDLYGKASITHITVPDNLEFAPAGSVDMVLSFRNFHGWLRDSNELAVLKAISKVLKPGGILGITDHRMTTVPKGTAGYANPEYLIAVAKEAGLELVGRSDVNNNPKDTKDHEKGVWTLPPVLAGDAANHDKMKAVGESDRFTLKFKKTK